MKYVFFLIIVFATVFVQAQTSGVKGNIFTNDKKPAAWVSIELKETGRKSIPNEDGSYEFRSIKAGIYTLSISYVGLVTQEKNLVLKENEMQVVDIFLDENSVELAEVIVAATKSMNEKIAAFAKGNIKSMDLPQSVVVINKEVLERQQVLRLSDVLQNVTGVYLYGARGGIQEEIGGRGFTFNSSNTFKNGIRYNNGTLPEMSSLEKIEILKGSTAILYGNVAAGGILNLVTKKPRFEQGGELNFRGGSYGFYKPSLDIYGSVNNSKRVAYRLNTTYEKANSFRDIVHSERFYINPSLLVKINAKTELLLEGDYLDDKRSNDFGVGTINYQLIDVPRNRFLGVAWGYYNTNQATATATVTHAINNKWQLRGIAAYQGFTSDLYGTSLPTTIQSNGNWQRGLQRSGSNEQYYTTQIDITGNFTTGNLAHSVLVGADADKYKTDAKAYTYTNIGSTIKTLYDSINVFDLTKYAQRNDIPDITNTTLTYIPVSRFGVYAQDLISITNKLKVLAGLRFTQQQSSGGFIDSVAKEKRTATIATLVNAFTQRFGVVYQPIKTISLFASYANSFTLNTGTDIYLQSLLPSYINQYEVGVKTELLKKMVSANITAYKILNSNLAQTSPTDANGNANSNTNIKELAGEVKSMGVEIDVQTKPINGFSIIAGYSFNETKYIKSNNFIVGTELVYNPKNTANASIYYLFKSTSAFKGFNLGVGSYYVGQRFGGRNPRITNPTYKLIQIPDYTLFDTNIGYAYQKISVRVKVSNLFNVMSYNIHDEYSINPIAPRQFAATLAIKL